MRPKSSDSNQPPPRGRRRHTRRSATEKARLQGWRRTLVLASIVFLVAVALQSVRLGASGLLVGLAESEFERWKDAPQKVGVDRVDRVLEQLAISLRIASSNPWALEKLGLLQLARIPTFRDPKLAIQATEGAAGYFRRALRERPTSAYLWAELALAKLYLNQLDEELFTAMRYAHKLGGKEPGVQEKLLFVALAIWENLDPSLKEAARAFVARSGERAPQRVWEIVKQFHRLDLVCGLAAYNSLVARDCEARVAPAKKRIGAARR